MIRRRHLLAGAGALVGVTALAKLASTRDGIVRDPVFEADPFTLGVASGDPLPDGVVLWTRLAPQPLAGGGMPASPVEMRWEVGDDERMGTIVRSGTVVASPELAHSVHVEVGGLDPGRWYWYRFRAGSWTSAIGRTRTAPAADETPAEARVAFAADQNWSQGYFAAYRDLAAAECDLVVFLGDYIYESAILPGAGVRDAHDIPVEARVAAETLDGYRRRYAIYKLDPDLQAVHARFPWVVTWDDHEVVNDYANDVSPTGPGKEQFLRRRAAAYQAAYEHLPLRVPPPSGAGLRIYRRFAFGRLFELTMLDERQYRSPQIATCSAAERSQRGGYCAAALDPGRTMLGAEQRPWLLEGLAATRARWAVIGNGVPFAPRNLGTAQAPSYGGDGDKWDGYAYERDEILAAIARGFERDGLNVVFVTGDLHTNWELDVRADRRAGAAIVATEFVATSISADGDKRGGRHTTRFGGTDANPDNLFFDDHNGYVLCTVRPDEVRVDFRVVSTVWERDAPATTLASFAVAHGRPGARLVAGS